LHCRAHEAANEARKLTPAARREKTVRKLNEDTSMGVHISLYQVKDLHHPQKQYKVDVNARQLYMTGNFNLAALTNPSDKVIWKMSKNFTLNP
jgi:hypothetical protein